jgi:hypothetical protein
MPPDSARSLQDDSLARIERCARGEHRMSVPLDGYGVSMAGLACEECGYEPDLCEAIVDVRDGVEIGCTNEKREAPASFRREGLRVQYCEAHDDVRSDNYSDVTLVWEGAVDSIETFYESTKGDYARYRAYVDKEETKIREQLDAMTASELASHLDHGGAVLEASHHTHEFDSREEYDAWIDNGADCFCDSFEKLFDSNDEYTACVA